VHAITCPRKFEIKTRSKMEKSEWITEELKAKCQCVDLYRQKSIRAVGRGKEGHTSVLVLLSKKITFYLLQSTVMTIPK